MVMQQLVEIVAFPLFGQGQCRGQFAQIRRPFGGDRRQSIIGLLEQFFRLPAGGNVLGYAEAADNLSFVAEFEFRLFAHPEYLAVDKQAVLDIIGLA